MILPRRRLLGGISAAFLLGSPSWVWAGDESLLEYIQNRDDLPSAAKRRWARAVRKRFGGVALDAETNNTPELGVAKAVLSSALFMGVEPGRAVEGAWQGWRSAQNGVPPPIAVHYQRLVFEGRKPRGRPIDLALSFPDHYVEEIAPDLVAWWEQALAEGKVPEELVPETQAALAATRLKMRPLLLDRLRLIARLSRDARRERRKGRRDEIRRNLRALESDLGTTFKGVSRQPEVLDSRRPPLERLRYALKEFRQSMTERDRQLARPAVFPKDPPPRPRSRTPPWRRDRSEPPPPSTEPPRTSEPAPRSPPSAPQRGATSHQSRLEESLEPWFGTPYRWGGDTAGVGTDCSGFTQSLFEETFNVQLPRVSRDQYRCGFSVKRGALKPGDLVFFDTDDQGRVNHVGVYLGAGAFAHASMSKGVVRSELGNSYYTRAYRGARRVLEPV